MGGNIVVAEAVKWIRGLLNLERGKKKQLNIDKIVINGSLIFGREASGFNHWRNSPRLVKVDSRRLLS